VCHMHSIWDVVNALNHDSGASFVEEPTMTLSPSPQCLERHARCRLIPVSTQGSREGSDGDFVEDAIGVAGGSGRVHRTTTTS
jgi:hypothetical protein